jgi:hypothetical protein
MSTTSTLTVLGFTIGLSQLLAQYHIYPEVATPVSAIATGIFGILAKGIDKR